MNNTDGKVTMWQKLKCFFGLHDWYLTKGGQEHLDKTMAQCSGTVMVQAEHRCQHCHKRELKGMGVYHL